MKNICILKGWFNMEEFKNGAISEEALDEIAGGLSISKSTVKNVLIAAGIGILAVGGTAGAYKYLGQKGKEEKHEEVKDPGHGEAFEKLHVKEKAAIWDKRIAEIK